MPRLLVFLLALGGVALGFVAVATRQAHRLEGRGRRPWTATIVGVALLVVALLTGDADAEDRRALMKRMRWNAALTCYVIRGTTPPTDERGNPLPPKSAGESLKERLELLQKARRDGKLTEPAYTSALQGIRAQVDAMRDADRALVADLDATLIPIGREVDARWLAEVRKTPAFARLRAQAEELKKLQAGKPNAFAPPAVEAALEELNKSGRIGEMTWALVGRTIRASQERGTAGEPRGFAIDRALAARKLDLASIVDRIRVGPIPDAEYGELLRRLFNAVECLEVGEDPDLCRAETPAQPLDRTLSVRALDLLIALFGA